MDTAFTLFSHSGWLFGGLILLAAVSQYRRTLRLLGIVIVPDDSIGTVTKFFKLFGSHRELPAGRIIALQGEAGLQADTLAPGLHFGFWPWQYQVDLVKFTVIPDDSIGIVEACDGLPLPDGRVLGQPVGCDNFQDARAFLQAGQRGLQMGVIPPGAWRINTLLFTVSVERMTITVRSADGFTFNLDVSQGACLAPEAARAGASCHAGQGAGDDAWPAHAWSRQRRPAWQIAPALWVGSGMGVAGVARRCGHVPAASSRLLHAHS